MRLSVKALAITFGVIWGGAVLLVGTANLLFVSYGVAFLQGLSSIYPGYDFTRSFGDLLIGTVYALIDGALAGLVMAWLYNKSLRAPKSAEINRV